MTRRNARAVISANTQARLEGYFRLEWRLAVERTHLMADAKPFLVPVVIDDTKDQDAEVPESFRAVQWTRLRGGETPPVFAGRRENHSPQTGVMVCTPAERAPAQGGCRSSIRKTVTRHWSIAIRPRGSRQPSHGCECDC
jgi:hypothetical protein